MSTSVAETREAWAAGVDDSADESKNVFTWIAEALEGDFNENRSVGQIVADAVVSLIPIVDTICDIRDLCANIRNYRKDPSKMAMFAIALTIVGFVPELGTIVKGVVKIVLAYLQPLFKLGEAALELSKVEKYTSRAVDSALPAIRQFLQNNKIVKWATRNRVPDIFRFVSKHLRKFVEHLQAAKLKHAIDEAIVAIEKLAKMVYYFVPTSISTRLEHTLDFLKANKDLLRNSMDEMLLPVRAALSTVAKRLDDHALIAHTQMVNRGFIAPISEISTAKLVNAKPPTWAKKTPKVVPNSKIDMKDAINLKAKFDKSRIDPKTPQWRNLPNISIEKIQDFSSIEKVHYPAGTKLYRIIDPTNAGGGPWWMTETEFNRLKSAADPKSDWRRFFAVKPNWNQDGQYVEYTVPEGGLAAFKGTVATQKIEGTDYMLEGGREQIFFTPQRDSMSEALPRRTPDGKPVVDEYGKTDNSIEWTDVTGEKSSAKVRESINDPNITGPFPTGWGFADWTPKQAKNILVVAPR